MAINRNFLVYNTKSKFSSDLGNDLIPANAIVFVKDTGEIYSHGSYFGGDISGGNSDYKSILLNGVSSNISIYGHKHSYTDLTGSTTTANQAIVSNGTTNGWTLKTLPTKLSQLTNDSGYWLGSSVLPGIQNGVDLSFESVPTGVSYYNHYSGSALGAYQAVLTAKDAKTGVQFSTLWNVENGNTPSGCIYYRVKRDFAPDWSNYRNILDTGNFSSYALPLTGGTMTGAIKSNFAPNTWIDGVTNASLTCNYTYYGAIFNAPVKDGRISLSTYHNNNNFLYFGFATTAQITAGTNALNSQIVFDMANSAINATTFQGTLSGNAASASKVNNTLSWSGYSSGSFNGSATASISIPTKLSQLTNDSGYWLGSSVLPGIQNGVDLSFESVPTGVSYYNHYSGSALGAYQAVLTAKDAKTGVQFSTLWNVDNGNTPSGCIYYRVKRDVASDWSNYRNILDTGNFSSYALPLHGTADSATVASRLGQNGNSGIPMTFNWSGQSGQPAWLWGGNDGTNMYVYNPSNFNVNSATKLQTPRNIWGQSFDGSGNVDGTLSIRNGSNSWAEGIRLHKSSGGWNTIILCGADNTGDYGTSANSWSIHNTNDNNFTIDRNGSDGANGLFINQLGQVGIGTTSPAYKLDVAGTGRFQGDLVIGNTIIHASGSNGGINSIQPSDDYIIGDCNIGGTMGLKSLDSASAGIGFYGQDGTNYGTLTASGSGLAWTGAIKATGGFVGNLTGTATAATEVIVNQHSGNNVNYPLVWSNDSSTNSVTANQLYKTASNLYFNPSTMQLTATGGFIGNVIGTVTTAGALTTNAGSASQPVYFSGGKPAACNYVFGNGNGNAAISNGTVCENLNANKLNGYTTSESAQTAFWGTIPVIDTSGNFQIGRNLYFNSNNGDFYDVKLSCDQQVLFTDSNFCPQTSNMCNLGSPSLVWSRIFTHSFLQIQKSSTEGTQLNASGIVIYDGGLVAPLDALLPSNPEDGMMEFFINSYGVALLIKARESCRCTICGYNAEIASYNAGDSIITIQPGRCDLFLYTSSLGWFIINPLG